MIKKTAPLPWHLVNTILLLLLLGLVAYSLYQARPQPQPYWFVSYQWTKDKERGAGRTCVKISEKRLDLSEIEATVAEKNRFTSVVIDNFREIDQIAYELCVKKP